MIVTSRGRVPFDVTQQCLLNISICISVACCYIKRIYLPPILKWCISVACCYIKCIYLPPILKLSNKHMKHSYYFNGCLRVTAIYCISKKKKLLSAWVSFSVVFDVQLRTKGSLERNCEMISKQRWKRKVKMNVFEHKVSPMAF